jgi:hypothetical protein
LEYNARVIWEPESLSRPDIVKGKIVTRTVADAKGQLRRLQDVGNWDGNDAKRDVDERRGSQKIAAGSKTSKSMKMNRKKSCLLS